jgi:hypothetical protein
MIASKLVCVLTLVALTSGLSTANARDEAPVAASPANEPTKKSEEGTPAKIMDPRLIESVLGRNVLSTSGENIGRIVDVLVDRKGQIRAAVIDFGGFLGLGTRKIAVDWSALHFGTKDSPSAIALDITRERLRVAPEVKPGEPVTIISSDTPSPPAGVEARS